MKFLWLILAAALALGSETWPSSAPSAPLAGFSYSPLTSQKAGRDPATDPTPLLDATPPDLARPPLYLDTVQPSPGRPGLPPVHVLKKVVAKPHRPTADPT